MATTTNNEKISTDDNVRINAIKKYIADPTTKIPIGGTLVHPSDIIAMFQDDLDARDAVNNRKADLKKALAVKRDKYLKRKTADKGLRAWVLNCYGVDSAEAHAFGYAPKTAVKTVDTKQRAIALNKATRAARGTKGPKAKLKIKGSLPPSPVPPVANTPTSAASPAAEPHVAASPAVTNGAAHA